LFREMQNCCGRKQRMKFSSKQMNFYSKHLNNRYAFTLLEAVVAIAILAAIISSVMTVMNRCISAVIDSRLQMQAFEVARENMEKLLASDSVSDMTEFGTSEKYPDIEWETSVEHFYEPITNRMWIQANCSATYTDSKNQSQTITLTHWITDLTKQQVKQILDQLKREEEYLAQKDANPFGDDPPGLLKYSDTLANAGKYLSASRVAEQIITDYPDSPEAQEALAKMAEYADALAENGFLVTASEVAQKIIENAPESPQAKKVLPKLSDYAFALAKKGDYRSASKIANNVVAQDPQSEQAKKLAENTSQWQQKAETQPETEPENPEPETAKPKKNGSSNNDFDWSVIDRMSEQDRQMWIKILEAFGITRD